MLLRCLFGVKYKPRTLVLGGVQWILGGIRRQSNVQRATNA